MKPEGQKTSYIDPQNAPASRSSGPFDITNFALPTSIISIPWSDVKGGHIIVGVAANEQPSTLLVDELLSTMTAEVTLVGRVIGVPSVIKRVTTSIFTGPVIHKFETWELYDRIDVLARNMSGGRPGPAAGFGELEGFRVALNIALQPRIVQEPRFG